MDWRVLAVRHRRRVRRRACLFGLVPALSTTGASFSQSVDDRTRHRSAPAVIALRRLLVVCEMALAVVLLVGAGLLVRSYQRMSGVNPGFAADHVLTFHLALPEAKYPTARRDARPDGDLRRSVSAGCPGVETAAAVFGLPLDDDFSASSSFTRPGDVDSADEPSAGMRIVTPDYFATLKIPLRSGRLFDDHDNAGAGEVVVDQRRGGAAVLAGIRIRSASRSSSASASCRAFAAGRRPSSASSAT